MRCTSEHRDVQPTTWLVVIARGSHPFPSRTRPLSPVARMVLPGQPGGRVRRRQPPYTQARFPNTPGCGLRAFSSPRSLRPLPYPAKSAEDTESHQNARESERSPQGQRERRKEESGTPGSLSWSPDGLTIAFNSNRVGNHDIWLVDADGDPRSGSCVPRVVPTLPRRDLP